MPVSKLRRANRGDIGTQALYFTTKSDALAGMVLAPAAAEVVLVTNTQRVVRLPVDSVTLWERWNGRTHPLTQTRKLSPSPTGINIKLTNPAFIKGAY